jgi:hypothetical protein
LTYKLSLKIEQLDRCAGSREPSPFLSVRPDRDGDPNSGSGA